MNKDVKSLLIDKDIHKLAKKYCVDEGIAIKHFVEKLIVEAVKTKKK